MSCELLPSTDWLHFEKALEKTGWVKNKAATLLNLNRTTLVEKLKKMNIRKED